MELELINGSIELVEKVVLGLDEFGCNFMDFDPFFKGDALIEELTKLGEVELVNDIVFSLVYELDYAVIVQVLKTGEDFVGVPLGVEFPNLDQRLQIEDVPDD